MNYNEIVAKVKRRARELTGPPASLTDYEIWKQIRGEIDKLNGALDIIIDQWGQAMVGAQLRRSRHTASTDQLSLLPDYPGCTQDMVVRAVRDGGTVTLPTLKARMVDLRDDNTKREKQIQADMRSSAYNRKLEHDLSLRMDAAGLTDDTALIEDLLKLPSVVVVATG